MYFFLQGERGIGKSYLLQQMLEPYQHHIAGFAVQRLKQDQAVIGFQVCNIRSGFPVLDVQEDEITDRSRIFIYQGKRNLAVLEEQIAQVEADSQKEWCRLILLDEIGGVELESPQFMEPLNRILGCGKPCAGVFKSSQNLVHTMRHQELGGDYQELHHSLEQKLKHNGMLVTMKEGNREQCELYLKRYLETLDRLR